MATEPTESNERTVRTGGSRILRYGLVGAFLAVLFLPGICMLVARAKSDAMPFEEAAPWPGTPRSVGAGVRFPRAFVRWFDSHFGFRKSLIDGHVWLKRRGIGLADSADVIIGKSGWLYYSGDRVIEDFGRLKPFTEGELEAWAKLLSARHDWLRRRGIPYLFFVAPNTHTIYPEHLPDWTIRTRNPSRLEQLTAYLKAHSDVDVLDLTPKLLAEKKQDRVYYRTDTHWNMVGAMVVYQEVSAWMKDRFPNWRPLGWSDYVRTETPGWHGGLGYMLGAPELSVEARVNFLPRQGGRVLTDGAPLPQDETKDSWIVRPVVVRESEDGEIPRAMIFRDSQMAAPAQLLSRHFRRSVLVWSSKFDPVLVEREHPNVVIQEIVERTLMGDVPQDPPLLP